MKHLLATSLLFIAFCSASTAAELNTLVVQHVAPQSDKDTRNAYFIDLLSLSLSKTKTDLGPFRLESSNVKMSQNRALQQLSKSQDIDVVWTMSSSEREANFLPIRIPLLKGLLGQRLLMIRREDLGRFAHINTLQDLHAFTAGQGKGWPDNKILEANQISVVEGMSYEGLFGMLQRQRFDYFPRGINEIFAELKQHPKEDFVAEPHLAISYRAPIYFFVNSNNLDLAARIEQGLWIAISDGSFNELFARYHYDDLAKQLLTRTVIKLDNPYLHPDTPSEHSPLWLKLN
ncbi:ABC transporter substrate-binding protein [Agarivorans sp. 1_MG-2023]|uniref:substrate-binding periplasmic protein n=1 Tax=Agarivorans sp. 1_MG-2023 TaxID=3062634 RepID=UPI0026E12F0F|nr:transporter substrate-binding domain-containing protein [Agarivorans sp. 1_MG-2023]MDO6766094.1 transporter substrate-binding domain-containing protein [Agarivorans sp. 1_MG-2023]